MCQPVEIWLDAIKVGRWIIQDDNPVGNKKTMRIGIILLPMVSAFMFKKIPKVLFAIL